MEGIISHIDQIKKKYKEISGKIMPDCCARSISESLFWLSDITVLNFSDKMLSDLF